MAASAAEHSDFFHHSPLNLEQRSIRLLRLLRGHDTTLCCEIFEATLDDDDLIEYEALSYTWGSEVTPESIQIDGRPKAITLNLFQALHSIRQELCDVIIWVDSICIDQDDGKEKSHQVRHMASIYRKAERVLIWLGIPSTKAYAALIGIAGFWERVRGLTSSHWGRDDPQWATLWDAKGPTWDEKVGVRSP